MTSYLIYPTLADALADAALIYQALHLTPSHHKTTTWDIPRQRLDGKWIILAPSAAVIDTLGQPVVEHYAPEWFASEEN